MYFEVYGMAYRSPTRMPITFKYKYHRVIVSVHRMVMESRPVDPGSIQGRESPTDLSIYIFHKDKT